MKKKLLLVIFAFFILFVSGCEKKGKEPVPGTLKDLKFLNSISYVDKQLLTVSDDELILTYQFDESDPLKELTISYNKNLDYSSIEDKGTSYETVTINGVAWRVVHTELKNFKEDYYYVIYKDALYQITMGNVGRYKVEFESFVNSLSFS